MRVALVSFFALAGLAACETTVPDSGAGVGFGSYDSYQAQRNAELQGQALPAPASAIGGLNPQAVSDETVTPQAPTSTEELIAQADAAIPGAVENAAGISSENDFGAVSGQRSIEQDAQRVAANKEQYQVIDATALPSRPSSAGASIVDFALSTSNRVGEAIYSRFIPGASNRAARNCAKYPSPDLAQQDFLDGGGPKQNAKGLDPDGDGFACTWDPAPFRLAAQSRAASN